MKALWASQAKIGHHRGNPRIYWQGKRLEAAGFCVGDKVTVEFGEGKIIVRISGTGDRTVSRKGKGENQVPVIDLNCRQIQEALGSASQIEISAYKGRFEITPVRTIEQKAKRRRNGLEGALFAGAGLLTLAAAQAGFNPAWAVERDKRCAEVFSLNHSTARVFDQCVREIRMERLGQVELLTAGVPCEPFSLIRRYNRDQSAPKEAHELLDMTFWALKCVDVVNPYHVLIENVPPYLDSAIGHLAMTALSLMGYRVYSRVLTARDYGSLSERSRAVIVATTSDEPFCWPEPFESGLCFGDVAEPGPHEWWDRSSKPWPFEHWERQTAKGNRFCSHVLTPSSEMVPAITKRYFNGQGTNVMVAHPTLPKTYRWLTIGEAKALMGVPESYELPSAKTVAGVMLGQAVVVPMFKRICEAIRGLK